MGALRSRVPKSRCQPAAPRRMPAAGLGRGLAMDPRWREGCIHQHPCRRRMPPPALPLPKLGLRRLAGDRGAGLDRLDALPLRRRAAACRRRVGKLYGAGRYFLCRHCCGLTYQSQQEQPYERALRRADSIRTRLRGEPGMASPFPEKPKGMHWRSYERLRQRAARAEGAANEHLWMWLGRLKARCSHQRKAKGFWI
jgi:hypothetical protein